MTTTLLKKGLVFVVIVLFVGVGVVLSISGIYKNFDNKKINVPCGKTDIQVNSSISCYVFGETGVTEGTVVLSSDGADIVYDMFENLKSEITHHPLSDETSILKLEFIDLLDEKGLMPEGISKDRFISLLNPSWLRQMEDNGNAVDYDDSRSQIGNTATSFFCSIVSGGSGVVFPPVLLPRPRVFNTWKSSTAITSVANLFTEKGFIASGGEE